MTFSKNKKIKRSNEETNQEKYPKYLYLSISKVQLPRIETWFDLGISYFAILQNVLSAFIHFPIHSHYLSEVG